MYKTFVLLSLCRNEKFTDLVSTLTGTFPSDFFLALLLQLLPVTQNSDLLELMPQSILQKLIHLVHSDLDLIIAHHSNESLIQF